MLGQTDPKEIIDGKRTFNRLYNIPNNTSDD